MTPRLVRTVLLAAAMGLITYFLAPTDYRVLLPLGIVQGVSFIIWFWAEWKQAEHLGLVFCGFGILLWGVVIVGYTHIINFSAGREVSSTLIFAIAAYLVPTVIGLMISIRLTPVWEKWNSKQS